MRAVFGLLSPAGPRARLPIFIFHRVLPQVDALFPDEVTADRFDTICQWLANWFKVMPLDRAVQALRDGCLPQRAACITFDDGYADNHDLALPVLRRHGLNATFFIATGFLDGGRMWNDTLIEAVRNTSREQIELDDFGLAERLPAATVNQRRTAILRAIDAAKYMAPDLRAQAVRRFAVRHATHLPDDLMMSSNQVKALRAASMVIGAHTVSHPILARMDADAAAAEIEQGRNALQTLLGERIGLFAYPNGKPGTDYLPANATQVKAMGFDAAVSTAWGVAHRDSDPCELPRFTPWDKGRTRFAVRVAQQMWASRARAG